MNQRLTAALERKIATHNRLVYLSTFGASLAVLAMWTVIYALGIWLPIFALTALQGVDAEAPVHLRQWISALMAGWMILGWFDRQQRLDREEMPTDETSFASVAFKVLMAPPRATFGVLDNPRNLVRLEAHERVLASSFLERLYFAGKLPMHAVPVELPDEHQRERVLAALRLTDLIRLRETEREDFLVLSQPERVRPFIPV